MPKPKVAGYKWKQKIVALVQEEKRDVPDLLRLMEVAATPATSSLIRGLIERNMARVEMLHELKDFRSELDEEGEDT